MATSVIRPIVAHGLYGKLPPTRKFPASSNFDGGESAYSKGASIIAVSGKVEVDFTPTAGQLVGFQTRNYASEPAEDTMIDVLMAIPGYVYELNYNGTPAVTERWDTDPFDLAGNPAQQGLTLDSFSVVASTSTNDNCQIISFGADSGHFVTDAYIGESDTSETAGADNYTNRELGIAGDTYPRVHVVFLAATCAWST